MAVTLTCFKCGKVSSYPERVGFREECDSCREDSHVCKNCHFYDPKAYNECREPQAEVVLEKERANRCDFFQPNGLKDSSGKNTKDALLSAAEALFKKKS